MSNNRVTTALLLAAGSGSRLQPLTNDVPKCLTEINGISILERQICCLRKWGFKRLVVVLGHLEHCIRKFLAEHATDLSIDYIINPQYSSTGNIYSLWLAREKIQEPFLLIECDLIFDTTLLEDMLHPDRIAISRIQPWMKGTTVTIDHSNRITAFHVNAYASMGNFKTVNIYSLSLSSWYQIRKRLEQHISVGKVKGYYETIFAEMSAENSLSFQAVFFDERFWYEIDTPHDLRAAECLFLENHQLLYSEV